MNENRLFDTYIAVDWSSRVVPSPKKPSEDAIWSAELTVHGGETEISDKYFRTRHGCKKYMLSRFNDLLTDGKRVLIGFDFAYSYPKGYSRALGLESQEKPWRKIWNVLDELIEDKEDNQNNRFKVASELNKMAGGERFGPLWGHPVKREYSHLNIKSPYNGYPFATDSNIEIEKYRESDKGESGIQPVWKLAGPGSVGGQTLVGIPTINFLRFEDSVKDYSFVWPFETGFDPSKFRNKGAKVVHVEIWPSIIPFSTSEEAPIKDQAQVRAVVSWMHQLDKSGDINTVLSRPKKLKSSDIKHVVNEEGWIFGAGINWSEGSDRQMHLKLKS